MYPVIIVSSSLSIPTYYLILSFTLCIALTWLAQRAEKFHLSRKIALDVSLVIMISGFIGGRLFHVFYEEFEYYREAPLKIFAFWNGGFVFYGGAILAAAAGIAYLWLRARKDIERYLDLLAPTLAFSYAIGRVACLFAGCCYGKYCDLPWAVAGRHPTQLYAAVWELGSLIVLLGLERGSRKHTGSVFYLWMILHGLGRILMESYRDDFRGPSLGFSVSTWISLMIIVTGSFLLARPLLQNQAKDKD